MHIVFIKIYFNAQWLYLIHLSTNPKICADQPGTLLRVRPRQTVTCGPGKEHDWVDQTRTQVVGPIGKGGPS